MTGGLDEEQTAVDPGILDVALTLSREFFAEVCRVLILDVFDNGVPAGAWLVKLLIQSGGGICSRTSGRC